MTDTEVPWFSEPPEAKLAWKEGDSMGFLHFIDPQGNRAVVPVMHEPAHYLPTTMSDGSPGSPMPIWQIEVDEATQVAIVRDSIHYIGHFHTPNPVRFKLVEELNA